MQPDKPAESVAAAVKTFIRQELVYGDEANFDEDADLIENGVIDSVSLLHLASYLEEQYDLQVQDEDLVPHNFRSLRSIEAFVTRCLNASRGKTRAE
jgi:acyl carrier protein